MDKQFNNNSKIQDAETEGPVLDEEDLKAGGN